MSNYFANLNAIDLSDKVREKGGLSYLPWSSVWSAVKHIHPDANYVVHEQILDDYGNTRPWFDDGRTGWVKVSVTIESITHTVPLPIMDMRNNAISADSITSTNANKSMMRALVKACGFHGIGLYVYEGEDIPDAVAELQEKRQRCWELVNKKSELSEKAKEAVRALCHAYSPDNGGDIRALEDIDALNELEKKLLAIRK